jgi:hypothetical protein
MPATLRLTREGFGIELRRGQFDVLLDGNPAGPIERHQTIETSIKPGRHILQIRHGRYASRPSSFEVADGETVTFQVHGAMIWPRYVASIVKPDLAISLKHVDSPR